MVKSKNTRVRKSPEERRREIMDAAVRLVGEKGYYGTSLKEIADAVGMSQPGLLHYIGTKEGLLSMLITDNYDVYGTPEDFMKAVCRAAIRKRRCSRPICAIWCGTTCSGASCYASIWCSSPRPIAPNIRCTSISRTVRRPFGTIIRHIHGAFRPNWGSGMNP